MAVQGPNREQINLHTPYASIRVLFVRSQKCSFLTVAYSGEGGEDIVKADQLPNSKIAQVRCFAIYFYKV